MENLLATDTRSGKPTNFGPVFKSTVQLLRNRQIPYVFIGTLALNTFIRPRFTDEMEIVCDCSEIEQLAEELRLNAEQHEGVVKIKVCNPSSLPMVHALHTKIRKARFDTSAYFSTALSLCWIFLESEVIQCTVNAGELLVAGTVNSTELRTLLVKRGSNQALSRLGKVEADIQQGRYSGPDGKDYCASVRARLQRQRLQLKNT